jgi:hypothetical protein
MDEFPGNSYASRIEKTKPERDVDVPKADREPKNIKKVISGTVGRRKKSLGARFLETFGGEDSDSIMDYVLFEVIFPDIKVMLYDALIQSVERKFGINTSGMSRTRAAFRNGTRPGDGRFNYNGVSSRRDRDRDRDRGDRDRDRDRDESRYLSRRARADHDFDELTFRDSYDAKKVLRKMKETLDYYELVTVSDFYTMVGVDADPPDEKWGWADLDEAHVVRLRNGDGYILDLPKPEYID